MKTGFLFYMLRWPSRLGRQTHRVFIVSSERHHLGYLEIAGSIPARSILFDPRLFRSRHALPHIFKAHAADYP
jgi:hypothetical protein